MPSARIGNVDLREPVGDRDFDDIHKALLKFGALEEADRVQSDPRRLSCVGRGRYAFTFAQL